MNFTEKVFDFNLHTNVKSGINIVNQLPEIIEEKGFNKIGFVIDNNLFNALPDLNLLIENCKNKFDYIKIHLYKEKFEPTYQYLDKVKLDFKENESPTVDCIIGIGGGSAIDLAKGIATLITNHEPAINYRGFPTGLNMSIPVVAIPSTAGTGTELAYNAVFIDEESKTKLGINTTNNYPILSLLDPKIVSTAPQSTILGSGLGALIRTFETFSTPSANSISKIFSIEAFKLIVHSLPTVLKYPNDLEAWSKMQWGSYFSMAALSNANSGPAGAMAYYLSTQFDVPQGLGYGISGLHYARLNHNLGYYGYSRFFDCLPKTTKKVSNEKQNSDMVILHIENIFKKFNVPSNLSSYGLKPSSFDDFFIFCNKTAKGSLDSNPIKLNDSDITQIINSMIGKK